MSPEMKIVETVLLSQLEKKPLRGFRQNPKAFCSWTHRCVFLRRSSLRNSTILPLNVNSLWAPYFVPRKTNVESVGRNWRLRINSTQLWFTAVKEVPIWDAGWRNGAEDVKFINIMGSGQRTKRNITTWTALLWISFSRPRTRPSRAIYYMSVPTCWLLVLYHSVHSLHHITGDLIIWSQRKKTWNLKWREWRGKLCLIWQLKSGSWLFLSGAGNVILYFELRFRKQKIYEPWIGSHLEKRKAEVED